MKPLLLFALCCVTAWGQKKPPEHIQFDCNAIAQYKISDGSQILRCLSKEGSTVEWHTILPVDCGAPFPQPEPTIEDRLRAIEHRLDELEKYVCENPHGCGPKELSWMLDVSALTPSHLIVLSAPDLLSAPVTALIEPEPITPFFVNVPWREWFFVPEPDKVNLIGE